MIRIVVGLIFAILFSVPAWAGQSIGIDLNFTGDSGNNQEVSNAIKIMVLLTILSLAPAILVVATSFTRIIIVLAMLRQAFGMPTTPPNMVLVSFALFLTFFTMSPVIEKIQKDAYEPYSAGTLNSEQALDKAAEQMRTFMLAQVRESDLALMIELRGDEKPKTATEVANGTLITAYMISELHTSFKIGFMIFLPFLVIDLLVASVLMALGMIMLPPTTISLPLKILVFVLIEGWALVAEALVRSF